MKKFGNNDTIFARVTLLGTEIINARIDGINSMNAIISWLKQTLSHHMGMITINIRNFTQGWSQSRAYRLA